MQKVKIHVMRKDIDYGDGLRETRKMRNKMRFMRFMLFTLVAVLFGASMASIAHGQNYPTMTPSTTQIAFAGADGGPLYPDQSATQTVTFTISNGPITFKQKSPGCKELPGYTTQGYTAECDDILMDAGCTGVWQNGDTCTITFTLTGDADDGQCSLTASNVAFPGIGCQGILNIAVPNNPNPVQIYYTYQSGNPNARLSVSPVALTFTAPGTQEFTITNTGDAPLDISNIAVTTDPADFQLVNDCPAVLDSRDVCGVNVTYNPQGTGKVEGIVTLSDNANPPAYYTSVVRLTGTDAGK